MSFGAIRDAATEWKNESGGGFRRETVPKRSPFF
jgi:hypothetical protein